MIRDNSMKAMEVMGNEKGFVLILGLVIMMVMTIIGVSIMMNMNVDMHLSRNEREAKVAFQLAEAGVNETIARLHLPSSRPRYIGERTTDVGYRTLAWAGNVDGNSFGLSTPSVERKSTDNLNYNVTVTYLSEDNPEGFCDDNNNVPNNPVTSGVPPASCDKETPEVVMFGRDFKIGALMTPISYGKHPVYRVLSTGTAPNNTVRTIEAYVGASSLNTDTGAGLNTNTCLNVAGGAGSVDSVIQDVGCADTCADLLAGIVAGGTCTAMVADVPMDTFLGDNIADVIDFADERHQCLGVTCTDPGDDIPSSGSLDSVITDWGDLAGDTYSTMIYIDNLGGKEVSLSGNFTGRGMLIVTGDLKLSGTLQYEGLVYVGGKLTVSGGGGDLNVTGGVMAHETVDLNGNVAITYDQETLLDVGRQSSASALLIWKRL